MIALSLPRIIPNIIHCSTPIKVGQNIFQKLSLISISSNFNGFFTTSSFNMSERPKVFVTRPDIPGSAMNLLKERYEVTSWTSECPCPREVLLQNVEGKDALFCLITDKIDEELLTKAGSTLKVIGTMSVGHDHVDLQAVKSRQIKLGYTPEVLTDATAELTIAVLLAASRRLFEARECLLNGEWARSAWGPLWMCGHGLSGSVVGIYGMGRIGKATMERLIPFKVKKFLYSGGRKGKRDDVTRAEYVDFDTLLRESDFVVVTAALTPETKEIFDSRAFSLMKPTAVFVNSSRGGLVKQDDLVAALKANEIFSAGLDVMTPEPLPTDHELTKLKNCVVIPHIGSATYQSREQMALLTARNIIAALAGDNMPAQLC